MRSPVGRNEQGAVAIMMAILAALLLITGALAVDLGNAWARKRDMQTQVDVALLAAGNWARDQDPILWPAESPEEQSAITLKVAEYIMEDKNSAIGMTETTVGQVNAALSDADMSNGDIEFLEGGEKIRLIPPPAKVQFGMATVFGFSSVDVTAPATIALKSELPGEDVIPLWIPDNCSFGAVEADTDPGGGPPADDGDEAGDFDIDSMAPATASVDETVQVTFTAKKTNFDGAPQITFTLTDDGTTVTAGSTDYSTSGSDATFTFDVGTNITGADSTWNVTVAGKNGKVSSPVTFTVGTGSEPATDPDEGCGGPDQGNFGQLNSPREAYGTTNRQARLMLNMLLGLDHQLLPHPNATQDSCESPVLANSQHDDVYRYGNNCIVGDTGNDGSKFADALIGKGGTKGRLSTDNGDTYSGCSGRSNIILDGFELNNDDLSCYLEDSYTPSDIAQPTATPDMLDPAIVDSPRFVWIPVVHATDRSEHDFQPILKFVPGLITSQNMTESADAFDAANDYHNGLECNGNSANCNSLDAIRIFTFNPEAVPNLPDSPVTDYDPEIGRAAVRLVE